MRDSVTFELVFPYGVAYWANLQLIRYSPLLLAFSAVFPLTGVFLLYLLITRQRQPSPYEILWEAFVLVLAFLFTPIVVALTQFLGRRKSPLSEGPFTYVVDSSGIRVASSAFETVIKWPAIRRVVETRSFLFLFVAPGRAISLPVAQLQSAEVFTDVRDIVRKNSVVPSA